MRLTSKGQVTIPLELRQALGLVPRAEVEVALDGDAVVIRKVRRPRKLDANVVARMRGSATSGLSTAAIMKLMRGR